MKHKNMSMLTLQKIYESQERWCDIIFNNWKKKSEVKGTELWVVLS